ncbi:DNA helicase, UvrD/REP type, P-loop containing nucleoside triphosphate hydrolase [Tanacetum coccineum]
MKSLMISKDNTRRKWHHNILGEMFGSFSFINVFSGKEVLDAENGMQNMVEVAVAMRIVQLLYKECASSKFKINIAVLSPYRAQVQCLKQKLEIHCQNNELFKVEVGLVDEYQGEKVDVVIISTAGAHAEEFIELNTSPNNTDVYFTWAGLDLRVLGTVEPFGSCRSQKVLPRQQNGERHQKLNGTTFAGAFVGTTFLINIAVLSPYRAQVQCLKQKLEIHCQNNELFKVEVGLVDEYQGEKVDVVIISTAGAHAEEFIELNTSPNNTDVYFTWAGQSLWILGDERVHLKKGSVWESMLLDAKARKCFYQADEHKELAKVIIEVKKDLHQLDELLSGETTLFRSTTWKVLFSSMFTSSFTKIESWETKKLVLLMLLKLSSGWRPKRSYTAAAVSESPYRDLMKEFKVKGLHIICTIDILKETNYTQVLKVWDILPFHKIEGLVKRLEEIIGMYTLEYIDHCTTRCVQRGSEFPMKWSATSEIVQYKTQVNHCDEMFVDGANGKRSVENVKVHESLILMKFYSLSTNSVNIMISGCDGGDLGLPFELTEQEKDVVLFDRSSFILGRSGTGKTTVLTMKLFQNEQLHHLASEGFHEVMERNEEEKHDVLHQLFVTFSSKLCYAVKQHVSEWKRSTCGGSSSSQNHSVCIDDIDKVMLSEDIPDHFTHLPNGAYPLIITFHRFLLMLDGTVGTSYFERFPSFRQLVCVNETSTSKLAVLEQYMRFKEVPYERFCSSYWPRFNHKLTKNFDPSTIYTEIMSVIKGGFIAGRDPYDILSRDDYVSLCDGRISILDAPKREIVYAIYLQYEKKKLENGHFDLADLVNDLHQRLEFEGYKGDLMDYVYIDEVQDLSMRQIMLFKYVCTNVHEGYAFSGDTAQAIAKGIGFRFEDIRCMFFRKFLLGSEKGKMSQIFQLSENFRTHAGVLNLAQSVIDLLCHYFPLFVDVLRPETSRICGELPVLLETDSNHNAIEIIFERKGDGSHHITGFGAEQVVLVRDESLKEKIVGIVGKNALVLTIMEAKGLEFQDVLLYDFFSTSPWSNEWRIIYEYMKENDLLNSPTSLSSCFDMEKHAVLCSELKQLYVAITRTRQRLWLCESTGFSQPVYDYWKKLSLVEVKHLSDLCAEKMQVPSCEDEWRTRGVKLFYENNFRMAQMCFLKAGDKYYETLAEAYYLRATADKAGFSQLERNKLFKDAAKLFSSVNKKELAAECFFEMGDYMTAGEIYLSESMPVKAGNCFYQAKCYERAVKEYEKAGAFTKCLSACSDGKLFEIGFELLGRWGGSVAAELEFLKKGALYYFANKDMKSMMKFVRSFPSKGEIQKFLADKSCFDELILVEKEWGDFEKAAKATHDGAVYYFAKNNFKRMMKFVRSFRSKDEMRRFLREKRCLDELVLLEKEWGNFEEVANVARLEPDPVLEADLLHMGGLHKESSLKILWHVFLNSTIFHSTDEPFKQKEKLLRKAVSIAKSDSDVFYQFVCNEAKILSEGKSEEELLKKGAEFIFCYKENAVAMGLKMVKTVYEIENIENDVLHLMHSSFKSLDLLPEFLLLLETRGKFVQAAKIINENDHSTEAALRRLWYVFFGSLWAHGRRAWPLKSFKQKDELLNDLNSYLTYNSDSRDSALMHIEMSILSGAEISLSQMWRCLREAPRGRSLRMHFLISRRVLDVHLLSHHSSIETMFEDGTLKDLEGVFSENIVSAEGLVYFWSYWKELVWELINWSYTQQQGVNSSNIYEDFLLNYFGVRKYDGGIDDSYVVLNAEAQWVKETSFSSITKNGYLYIIGAREFLSMATRYWCSEILFVSEKVLKKLHSLHAYSTVKNFPMHKKTKILTGLFEVTQSLQICKLPYNRPRASSLADQYFKLCVDHLFCNVFHINWKNAQSKEMIFLRGKGTFLNMLKEALNINRKSYCSGLTCGQMGRMAMIFLGSKITGFNDDTKKKVHYKKK